MHIRSVLIVGILGMIVTEPTFGQQGLFGQRQLGRSLSRRGTSQQLGQSGASAGALDQNRRFLRDQRSATDFVGSTVSGGGPAGFVGGQSAVTAVTSSVAGLTEEIRVPINRPRIVRLTGLYPERLTMDERLQTPDLPALAIQPLSESLLSLIETRGLKIEVSPEGHSATLRGAVPSAEDRQLIELLVKFEPGIQKVSNELSVDPTLPSYPQRRSPGSTKAAD